ncbi:MAG: YqgE/AlgH family protein [Paracoccaceae bacterium]
MEPTPLIGKLLVAMPGIDDGRFAHSVILICDHGDEGSMGLIVNEPIPEIPPAAILDQLGIEGAGDGTPELPVHRGGPMEDGRGFVLHSREEEGEAPDIEVSADLGVTATTDMLERIAAGHGPARVMLCLGYAGWAPGQLEHELSCHVWLTVDGSEALVFGATDPQARWTDAMRAQGVDPSLLSGVGGRA